jgi:hypothetical protein
MAKDGVVDTKRLEELVAQRQEMLRRGECEVVEWREAMARVKHELDHDGGTS